MDTETSVKSHYFTIRLRDDFRAVMERYAEADDRSISWEIVYAIERYIDERERALDAPSDPVT